MTTNLPQYIFDKLISWHIYKRPNSGWSRNDSVYHPSITVTSEVLLSLIDVVENSFVQTNEKFEDILSSSVDFVVSDVKERSKDNSLDLSNCMRALTAYMAYKRYSNSSDYDEDFIQICQNGIERLFDASSATPNDLWLYVNGHRDLIDFAPNIFTGQRVSYELAKTRITDWARHNELSSYEAAVFLDILAPRSLKDSINVNITESMYECITVIANNQTDPISELLITNHSDTYRVTTPAFVLRALGILRSTPELPPQAKKYFYKLMINVQETIDKTKERYELAHLLRAFGHIGIQIEDAEYIVSLLEENKTLQSSLDELIKGDQLTSDVDALKNVKNRTLLYVGEPGNRFFGVFTTSLYFYLFFTALIMFYLIFGLVDQPVARFLSGLGLFTVIIFLAYQGYTIEKKWRTRSYQERSKLIALFFFITSISILNAVAVLKEFDEPFFSFLKSLVSTY